jgi:hypothetical protein
MARANGTTRKFNPRWMWNIKADLLEIERGGVDWTGLAQDRETFRTLVNAVMNLE